MYRVTILPHYNISAPPIAHFNEMKLTCETTLKQRLNMNICSTLINTLLHPPSSLLPIGPLPLLHSLPPPLPFPCLHLPPHTISRFPQSHNIAKTSVAFLTSR